MSDSKKSLLSPVGKAVACQVVNGMTTMTVAVFDASQVPEGSELYVQPKDSRLRLEVEVANDNAAHHRKVAIDRGEWISQARKLFRELQSPAAGLAPDLLNKINAFMEPKQ